MELNRPNKDDIEVSVFGPGYGECILIHVGDSKWIVVDSCLNKDSMQPSSIEYFNKIGVSPKEDVIQIISTHWHDDHIRGLSNVLECSLKSKFICSAALRIQEFISLVKAYKANALIQSSGVNEFDRIIEILQKRSLQPRFAKAGDSLNIRLGNSSKNCKIDFLSPSDISIDKAFQNIKSNLPKENTPKHRINSISPNLTAIALKIHIDNQCILLGSDLEETFKGWSTVINSQKNSSKAEVYKVAHHGSENGDFDGIWTKLLINNPKAAITPFQLGRTKLPTKEGIVKLKTRTNNLYITALPNHKKKKRQGMVEKEVNNTVKSIWEVQYATGHIRMRYSKNSWDVDLFNNAKKL